MLLLESNQFLRHQGGEALLPSAIHWHLRAAGPYRRDQEHGITTHYWPTSILLIEQEEAHELDQGLRRIILEKASV